MQQGGGGGKSMKLVNIENVNGNEENRIKSTKENEKVKQYKTQKKSQRRPLGDICNVLQQTSVSNVRSPSNEGYLQLKKRQHDQVLPSSPNTHNRTNGSEAENEVTNKRFKTDQCPEDQGVENLDPHEIEELDEYGLTNSERLFYLKEYVDDVYEYLRKLEIVNQVPPNHLDTVHISAKTRAILVDWMVEVILNFELCEETLELSVYLLDKFIELRKTINKRNAQLIALVCIFVAAKYEEVNSLDVCDLVVVSDSAVNRRDILRLEKVMLSTFDFNLSRPLPIHFVKRYALIAQLTPVEQFCALYFCDAAHLEYSLCSTRPSMLAAGAIFLALCVTQEQVCLKVWTDKLIKVSTYQVKDFFHILPRIAIAVRTCCLSKLEAIRRKYATDKCYYVSLMPTVHPSIKGSVIEYFCQ